MQRNKDRHRLGVRGGRLLCDVIKKEESPLDMQNEEDILRTRSILWKFGIGQCGGMILRVRVAGIFNMHLINVYCI